MSLETVYQQFLLTTHYVLIYCMDNCMKYIENNPVLQYYIGILLYKYTYAKTWLEINVLKYIRRTPEPEKETDQTTQDKLKPNNNFIYLTNKSKEEMVDQIWLSEKYECNVLQIPFSEKPYREEKEEVITNSKVSFLMVEYSSSGKESITFDIDNKWCLVGNELFSPAFVFWYLKQISMEDKFSMDYTITLLDENADTTTIKSNQYILIESEMYITKFLQRENDSEKKENDSADGTKDDEYEIEEF